MVCFLPQNLLPFLLTDAHSVAYCQILFPPRAEFLACDIHLSKHWYCHDH
uniref:Uncharacterized protein n=1 Tax=Arundo donax TaxID=35708 RepID=A0A0A9GNC7_ARUDO